MAIELYLYTIVYLFLRLFQHTELEHTPKKPLPTGLPQVCDMGVCCNFLGLLMIDYLQLSNN